MLLALYGIWATSQGLPVGIMGPDDDPPPHRGCFRVLIVTDQRSMWGRKCPHCKQYWRAGTPGLAEVTVCPYCGKYSRAFECLSDAQRAYVDACCILYERILTEEKDGYYEISARELLAQAMASEDGVTPAPPEFFMEKQRQTRFTCDSCANATDVLGRFAYCSSCGTRNDAALLRHDLDGLRTGILAGASPTTALKEAVDAFDAVGRNLARQLTSLVPMTKSRRARWDRVNFQQLEATARILKSDFDIDIFDGISDSDRNAAALRFHRRHLYAHRGGVVDQQYIDDSGDRTVQVGLLIQETRETVLPLLSQVSKLTENLVRGFHSVIPVQDTPIRHYREKLVTISHHAKQQNPTVRPK